MKNLKIGDQVKVRIYGFNKKVIKTNNFDEVFTVSEENGKLGIYWVGEFAPLDSFCNTEFLIIESKNQLLERVKMLEVYEVEADVALNEYENPPEDIEKEKYFDSCYKKECYAFIALANAIVNFTDGKIDFLSAKKMILYKRQELYALLTA